MTFQIVFNGILEGLRSEEIGFRTVTHKDCRRQGTYKGGNVMFIVHPPFRAEQKRADQIQELGSCSVEHNLLILHNITFQDCMIELVEQAVTFCFHLVQIFQFMLTCTTQVFCCFV